MEKKKVRDDYVFGTSKDELDKIALAIPLEEKREAFLKFKKKLQEVLTQFHPVELPLVHLSIRSKIAKQLTPEILALVDIIIQCAFMEETIRRAEEINHEEK